MKAPKTPEANYKIIVGLLKDSLLSYEQIARLVGVHRSRIGHVALQSGLSKVRAKAEKTYQRKAKDALKKLRTKYAQ